MKLCITGYVISNEKDEFGGHEILYSITTSSYEISEKACYNYIKDNGLEGKSFVQVEDTTEKYKQFEEEFCDD